MKIKEAKHLEGLLTKLGLKCKECSQEKAIIVDRHRPLVNVNTLESDGKVRVRQCYPMHRHPLYCSYHLKEGKLLVGRES